MREYDHEQLAGELFDFIEKSPESFHAAANLAKMLEDAGYARLNEGDAWDLREGQGYYVLRNGSSIIAFRYRSEFAGFQIAASHSDCPSFKIKDKAELCSEFIRLNTEKYGGMICSTWLDRPLSVAGRVLVDEGDRIEARLVNIDRDLLLVLRDASYVVNLKPDQEKLKELDGLTVAVTAPGDGQIIDCVSRVFVPKLNIAEDPVTGSTHCMITPYWCRQLGKDRLTCQQASERSGILYTELCQDRVKISGKAVLYSVGDILGNEPAQVSLAG